MATNTTQEAGNMTATMLRRRDDGTYEHVPADEETIASRIRSFVSVIQNGDAPGTDRYGQITVHYSPVGRCGNGSGSLAWLTERRHEPDNQASFWHHEPFSVSMFPAFWERLMRRRVTS